MSEIATVFKTPDGKVFSSMEQAQAHLQRSQFTYLVNEFIASREWKKGQSTRAAGLVADFLVWESQKS